MKQRSSHKHSSPHTTALRVECAVDGRREAHFISEMASYPISGPECTYNHPRFG